MNDENHFKERIEEILAKHPEGLSIAEISRLLGAHRHTVTKYIQFLMGAGVIYQRDLGTVKLHYLASKLPEKEKLLLEKLNRRGKK
ncbi:MAG TPA: helix-turn-helix domain-containing protein [archaeon]|nr:helix-turn-helix domain-containing protein [archaeon]